jgi:hypothetical protein
MATKKTPAKQETAGVPATQGADLNTLIAQAAQAEAIIRSESGSNLQWIKILDPSSNELIPEDAAYIKGAKARDLVIAASKTRLGQVVDATVIGMFKVFAEVERPAVAGDMPKTVGYWHPTDAMQVPLEGNFDRPLANGHVLQPVHWVFLYLHDNPDLEGVVLSFRSIGNKYYNDLEKIVKANSKIVPELRFSISAQAVKNEKYNRTYLYPKFELQEQRNCAYSPETGLTSVKGGLDKETLQEVLTRYGEVYKAFNEYTLVSKRQNISQYLPSAEKTVAEIADEDDGQEVRF